MNAKVNDLMSASVVTTQPHKTVEHVRAILERNHLSAVPIVDSEDQPVGIVSATDLLPDLKPNAPISSVKSPAPING